MNHRSRYTGSIVTGMPFACAVHEITLDQFGMPYGYIFCEVNDQFLRLTGLNKEDVIGRNVIEVIPDICKDSFDWIGEYAKVALGQCVLHTKQFSNAFQRWFEIQAYSPEIGFFVTLIEDVTDKKNLELKLTEAEMTVERQTILIDVYNKEFPDQQSFLDYTLEKAVSFTGSQYGYIYLYDEQEEKFTVNTWTKKVQEDSQVTIQPNFYQLQNTGFWGEVVRQRKPIVNNNFPAPHPHKKGVPAGHVPLKNFMSIPVFYKGQIVAVVGLSNKESDYTDLDIHQLILLMQSVFLINQQRNLQAELNVQRKMLQSIVENLSIPFCEFSADTTLLYVNSAYAQYFKSTPEDMVGRKFVEYIPVDERATVLNRLQDLSAMNSAVSNIHHVQAGDECRWMEWIDMVLINDESSDEVYFSIGNDITERMKIEEEKEQALSIMTSMVNGHTAVMLLMDPSNGKIVRANAAASDFYGYSVSELLNMTIYEINALGSENIQSSLSDVQQNKKRYFTFPHRMKNGEIRYVDVYSCTINIRNQELIYSIIFDVTDREDAIRETRHLTYHDYLTGLYNRRYLKEEFQRQNTPENYPIAIILGDLNGLKKINDLYGNVAGDQVIKTFATVLKQYVSEETVLARVGGDAFALMLTRVSEDTVKALTDRLDSEIKISIHELDDALPQGVTASFGYGIQLCQQESLDALLHEAETYMYRRKFYDRDSKRSQVIDVIMGALFEKSERDQLHSIRVSKYCEMIARALNLSEEKVARIKVAASLHDIGKIGIDEKILNKEGQLSDQEWEMMRQHPVRSARILASIDEYSDIVHIVESHHEREDGSGYPEGLTADQIPLESKIIAVADAFDAMTAKRPYRPIINKNEAVAELTQCAGSQFDLSIVEMFVQEVIPHIELEP